MNDVLDKIQGLNTVLNTLLNNNSSIEFDLNGYISKFIKIRTPDYKDENQTITEKIDYLKLMNTPNEYDKEDMEQFLENYHDSLKGAIEITTKLKPTELVKNDVVIGDINNTQPNSAPDETELPVKNELDKFNGTFGQEQQASGCGRHALNNLLGHAYFTGFNSKINDNPYTLDELKDIIENITEKQLNLDKLCKYLDIRELNITGISEDKPCPTDENYNINVLIIALGLIGFEINNTFQFNKDKANKVNKANKAPNIDDTNVFGLLININKTHWVSARKYETEKTETEKNEIYYMDSLNENVTAKIEKAKLNEIIMNANNTTHTIINAGDRKKGFIHLKIDDFITNNVDGSEKQIFYNNLYSYYIRDLQDTVIIDNLYSKEFQYNKELISLIKNDINYGNGEEILKQLLGEPKTKNDTPTKQHDTRSKNQDTNKLKHP